MNSFNETFSKNLRTLMAYNDKQQKELAEYLHVSTSSVSDWCKGLKTPRANKLDDICRFLHCTRTDLFGDELITFTEFKNQAAKRELLAVIDELNKEEIASVLAFIKTMRGINESNQN